MSRRGSPPQHPNDPSVGPWDQLLIDELEPGAERGPEAVERVVLEHVLARRQETPNHRIVASDPLHDRLMTEPRGIDLSISRVTSLGAAAPGTSTAPTTRSDTATDSAIV